MRNEGDPGQRGAIYSRARSRGEETTLEIRCRLYVRLSRSFPHSLAFSASGMKGRLRLLIPGTTVDRIEMITDESPETDRERERERERDLSRDPVRQDARLTRF